MGDAAKNGQGIFTPALTTTDWNAEWKRLQQARHAADNAAFWDERSKTYHKSTKDPSPYVLQFLEYTGVRPGETVFDMGCGTGAITMPLAREGHDVTAADFSKGMLGVLEAEVDAEHVPVTTVLLSWADDWEAHGIEPKSFDVATASRSIATDDLRESLEKLSRVARRRCAITLATGSSPRADEAILTALGIQRYLGRDFMYSFMILTSMGYFPEVRYIVSERHDSYADEEEAYESISKMVVGASHIATPEEIDSALARLRTWLPENLVENPLAGHVNEFGETEQKLRLKNTRKTTWAHIAWNV